MIKRGGYIVNVISQDGHNLLQVFIKRIGGYTLINKFTDIMGSDPNNNKTFTRIIGNLTIHYENGNKALIEELIDVPYIKKLKPFERKKSNFSALALDIETREVNDKHEPILLSIYAKPTGKLKSFPI